MILLVVDTQKGIMNDNLLMYQTVKNNIKTLIDTARNNGVEIIFVRHDDGPGNELTSGNDYMDKETC